MEHVIRGIPIRVVMEIVVMNVVIGRCSNNFARYDEAVIIVIELVVIDLIVRVPGVVGVADSPPDIVQDIVIHPPIRAADENSAISVHSG